MKTFFLLCFMPLGLLLMAILACAMLAWRRRYSGGLKGGVAAGLLLGVFVFGWVFSTPLVGQGLGMFLLQQVRGRELTNPQDAQAIVVLTAGMTNAGPVGWLPRAETIHRVAVAYELQRMINLRLPVVISGGYTLGVQAPSEARVAAEFFARNRSELTPTELEEVSTDTYESALQLAPVLAKRGWRNVILVTGDVHMLRSLAVYRARGIDAIPVPALELPQEPGVEMFLPSVRGLKLTTEALYEVYGLLAYVIAGRISLNDLTYNQIRVN